MNPFVAHTSKRKYISQRNRHQDWLEKRPAKRIHEFSSLELLAELETRELGIVWRVFKSNGQRENHVIRSVNDWENMKMKQRNLPRKSKPNGSSSQTRPSLLRSPELTHAATSAGR